MAEPKESRLAEILRAELKAGKGLAEALSTSYKERAKERADLRKMFPQYGVLGQVMRSIGGSAYKYGAPKSVAEKKEQKEKTVANVAVKMMARNTSVLPAMARDMNIMKRNMQELVSIWGNRKITRAESGYLKVAGQRRATPQTKQGGTPAQSKTNSFLGNVAGGLFGAASFATDLAGGLIKGVLSVLGTGLKLGGGLLLGAASVLGSLFSGVIGVGGGLIGGLFRGLTSAVSSMGLFGLIALAGAGFLTYQISKSIKGTLDFDNIYDTIKEKFKSFFDIKEGESFKDIVYGALGKFDEKTGLNSTAVFEGIERSFAKFIGFSSSMIESIVQIVAKTSQLAMNELQVSFLRYGVAIVKIMGEIGGILTGGKLAGVGGTALAGLMSAIGPTGGIGLVAKLGAFVLGAGGMAYAGYKGSQALSERLKDFLVESTASKEQKTLINQMRSDKDFMKQVDIIQDNIDFIESEKKLIDMGIRDEARGNLQIRASQKAIQKARESESFKKYGALFKEQFGINFTDMDSIQEGLLKEKEKTSEVLKRDIGILSRGMYDQAQTAGQFESNKVEREQERRREEVQQPNAPSKVPKTSEGKNISVEEAINFFTSKGFSREQASGIVSNLWYESGGLNATAVNPTSGAYGLAQWLGPRQKAFYAWAEKKGYSIRDPKAQLEFIMEEFKTTEKNAYDRLKGAKTAQEASDIMLDYYERPSEQEKAGRAGRNARQLAAISFSGGGGALTTPSMYADASKRSELISQFEKDKQEENKEFSEYFKESMDRAFGLSAAAAADSSVQGKSQTELLAMMVTELREVKNRISSGSTTSTVDQNFIKTYERITGIA